jgi:hypothetical protein
MNRFEIGKLFARILRCYRRFWSSGICVLKNLVPFVEQFGKQIENRITLMIFVHRVTISTDINLMHKAIKICYYFLTSMILAILMDLTPNLLLLLRFRNSFKLFQMKFGVLLIYKVLLCAVNLRGIFLSNWDYFLAREVF